MNSLNRTGWYSDLPRAKVENACEWPEIGCECEGGDGLCKISFVSFYGMDLTGELPRDGLPNKLEGVKIFDVGNNRLRGVVTNAFVRSFPNLKSLKLGVNNLEGSIPYELGNLKWLEEIDLDGGFTERQIYYDDGFPEAKKNKYGVPGSHFGNQFTGQIPESFRFLQRLKVLNIHRNLLSGPISYNALAYLQSLEYLDLSGNRDLSGQIPAAAIGRLPNIKELFLDDCAFSGPIPLGMSSAEKLEVIVLEGNKLSGRVNPRAFPINITTLDLHDNFFSGPIPETLSIFKRLEVLLLHGNMFSGEVPQSLRRLPVLKTVSLAFNRNLCGPIPFFLPNAPKEAIEEECDKPTEPCKLYPARIETNLGKPCDCARRGQSCFSSASSIVLSLPTGASAEKCCEEGFSCEPTSGFGEKSCVPCMNANERCDGTVYGRPSCCKAGLICDGDGVCKGCSQTYQQCGGEYWTGAECCTSGNSCVFVDRYYSQCRPSSSFTIGDGTTSNYDRQYRSTNNSSTEIQRHPLRVKKNGSSAAVDFGPARIDVATRTTFVSFKMNTTRNVGRKYQRARPTMANAVVVCGRKTPAALSTAAAIRVITASRKTNIIRSAARGTSTTVYRARERTNSAVVASDRTVLGVVRTLATTVSCKTRITRSVVRRCSRNSIFFLNPIEKKNGCFLH